MKKYLVPLTAILATGVASAQSTVNLWGVLDLSYESVKTTAGRISGLAPSASASSRLGFRGVEDLGGGMTAGFWLEAALNPASGLGSSGTTTNNQVKDISAGGLTFNRRSTISLAGAFGEMRFGRDFSASYRNYAAYDPFGNNSVASALNVYTGNGLAETFVRASNSAAYFLPGNLGGFYGEAMYAFANRPSNQTQAVPAVYGASPVNSKDNGRYAGLRFGYAEGPIDAAISYGKTTYAAGTKAVNVGGFASTAGDFSDFNAGGSYQFGSVKAMALFSRQKADDFGLPGVNRTMTGWLLGADVGIGAGDLLASYSTVKLGGFDARGKKFGLGYMYNLSKRTGVYGIFSHVSNTGGASFDAASFSSGALGSVTGAVNANGRSTGVDIGLRHNF